MKKSQLKPLIKQVLRELYNKNINESNSSETYQDYEMELENLIIPGISSHGDTINVLTNVDYEYDSGQEERGQFGPPDNSSPAEPASISLLDITILSIRITSIDGKQKEIENLSSLSKEQSKVIYSAVENYISENEDSIKEKIANSHGDMN